MGRGSRRGRKSSHVGSGGGSADPRADVKQMFGDANPRPALLSRLGLVEGAVNEGEFYTMVDVAMLKL